LTQQANDLYYQHKYLEAQPLYERALALTTYVAPYYGSAALINLSNLWRYTNRISEAKRVDMLMMTKLGKQRERGRFDDADEERAFLQIIDELPTGEHTGRMTKQQLQKLYAELLASRDQISNQDLSHSVLAALKGAVRAAKELGGKDQTYVETLSIYTNALLE